MIIEVMHMKDYEEAYKLWSSTKGMGLRSIDDSEGGIAFFIKRNQNTNFICRIDGELVGVILCGHDGRRGYIYHAVVDEKQRNKGIGKELVNRVIEALSKEGINKVALVVFSDNQNGNDFWDSIGFEKREDLCYRNRSINLRNI